MKGRFQSLKGIRVEIKTAHDLNFFCEWILVCIILHNIFIRLNDSWEDEDHDGAYGEEHHNNPVVDI